MLITFQEDGTLQIYQSVDEAVRDVEALDAEDVFRSIFDETGRCYSISWIRPNQYGRFTAQNGDYTLVPDGRIDLARLKKTIEEAERVEPESLRPWLLNLAASIEDR